MPCMISEMIWQSKLPLCARACVVRSIVPVPKSGACLSANWWCVHRFSLAKGPRGSYCAGPGGWCHRSLRPMKRQAPIPCFPARNGTTVVCRTGSPRHDLAGHRVGNPTTRGRFWVYRGAQPGRPGCTGLCVWAPCSGRVRTHSPLSNTPAQAQVQCRTGGFCCCPKTTQEPKTRLCFRNRKAFSEKG